MTETDQPLVPPPVIETKSRWHDPITINAIWFAISTRSNILTPLLLPLLVQNFVGEASKGGAYGNLRLVSLMIVALSGLAACSQTAHFQIRRRRPIILIAANSPQCYLHRHRGDRRHNARTGSRMRL